ncbi:hypothetical protein ACFE04_001356 [Oxalis oulophora]
MPEPNVQEMVKNDPSTVTERYRQEQPQLVSQNVSRLSSRIPVIDLRLLSEGDINELNSLDQVLNHGLEKEILQNMKSAAADFFALPLEEKNRFATTPTSNRMGYVKGAAVVDDQKLDWLESLLLRVYPIRTETLQYWPTNLDGFKDTVMVYSNGVRKVAEQLLRSISVIMDMDEDGLLGLNEHSSQVLRINYCSPCAKPDEVVGLSPHSDLNTISIVMQEDNVAGLQIKHKGEWVLVDVIPSALVVNVGDVLEVWSNGKYKSVEHQVMPNRNKLRMSYATFLSPDADVEIEPLHHMVDGNPLYKKIRYGDYLRALDNKLKSKTHLDMIKITA